ncbi:MAG: hypothetical protein GYB36_13165 [Alphaproteobacteria bacterium]|nr:hypothetical protein [Alphaproteobacteria bacterium]
MLKKLIILTSLLSLTCTPAFAADPATVFAELQNSDMRDRYTAGQARDSRNSGDVVPAIRVISQVRQRYPNAQVLDAELEGGSDPRYVVKILTADGRRVDVVADARTGRILYER